MNHPGNNNFNNNNFNNNHYNQWQNHPQYNNWHHGYWHGHWPGNPGYGYRPYWGYGAGLAAFGLAAWGVGNLGYNSGYYAYTNPYYSQPVPVGNGVSLDYSQPFQYTSGLDTPPDATDPSQVSFDAARGAFQQGDYDQALASINEALASTPQDAAMNEFRALVLFAQQDYRQAAATINSVLAVGPGWDWTTMSGLYPNVDIYTGQLRALEAYVKQNPAAADGRFLLGYHYLTAGHNEAAARQFQQVVKLAPQDSVAAQLLQSLTPSQQPQGTDPADNQNLPVPESVAGGEPPAGAVPLEQAQMVGDWKAERPDGGKFGLTLTDDSKFTWTFQSGETNNAIEGTYTLGPNMLILADSKGGTMVGQVAIGNADEFTFRMVGGPPSDPGLNFQK